MQTYASDSYVFLIARSLQVQAGKTNTYLYKYLLRSIFIPRNKWKPLPIIMPFQKKLITLSQRAVRMFFG